MATFDTPLSQVLGGRAASALSKALELRTVGELLRHYPRRYAERGELTDLADLTVGEEVTVLAEVRKVHSRPMRARRGRLLEVIVGGGTSGRHDLTLTFFNQPWREKDLQVGRRGLFAGKVTEFNRKRQLNKPDYIMFDAAGNPTAVRSATGIGTRATDSPAGTHTSAGAGGLAGADGGVDLIEEFVGTLIPVYPSASGLRSWTIAKCVRVVLDTLDPPPDPLPDSLRARYRLVDLHTGLREIHRPSSQDGLRTARTRLKWDEAVTLQVTLAQRRRAAGARPAKARPGRPGGLLDAFDARLPFALTAGQQEIGAVIAADLAGEHPMHRLLQGEVGSGKTVCALRAMLQVVDAGGQAALLAPTEVLAAQHARSLRDLLGPLGRAGELDAAESATRIALLSGSLGARERRAALAEAASGAAGIVVGTHALIQEGVSFADLGLLVVDEQHRFGVEQRDALRTRSTKPPHLLVMTATPIPRTVAMTVYGDLETLALRELPRGRSPISTSVVPAADKPHWLDRAWQRVREEVAAGHQAYVVCPRIGETAGGGSGDEDAAGPDGGDGPDGLDGAESGEGRRPPLAVLDVAPELAAQALSGLRVETLHGRLPADEKDGVMRRFAAGEVDVLVATTVVEVGVDVPNATVMVVLDADRFGVSQLHQLRGRVGRGSAPGLCLLVTETPEAAPARTRLDAVASTLDGFELARLDLEARREGDVLGAAQSGRRSQVRMLSLLRDEAIIGQARDEAAALVDADPDLTAHPALAAEVAALVEDDRADYLQKT